MASVGRKRVGGSAGAPLKTVGAPTSGNPGVDKSLEAAATNARNAATIKNSTPDPFAEQVKKMNNDLKAFQDKNALSTLASDHPEDFIVYAKEQIAKGDTNYPWNDLLKKAQNKIEETQWADDLKNGTKNLEEFQNHLIEKLSGTKPGSTDNASILKGMASVKSAISARDEAKKDQTALVSYIKSSDHAAYKEYLENKLARTTDTKLQTDIVKQIGEMDSRITKQNQSDRAVAVLKIEQDAKTGRITTSEALTKLQGIAGAKDITSSEAQHLQTVSDSILNASAAKVSAGSKAAQAEQTAHLNANRAELSAAQQNIKDKLAAGQQVTQEDIDRVTAASKVMQTLSEAVVSDPHSSAGTSRSAATEAKSAAGAPQAMKQLVDTKTLSDFGMDSKGTAAFKAQLAATTDPFEKAKLLIDRANDAKMSTGKMLIPDNAATGIREGGTAYVEARKVITGMTATPKQTAEETAAMHQQYIKYVALVGGQNALPESKWNEVMTSAPNAEAALKQLGIKPDQKSKADDGSEHNTAAIIAGDFNTIIQPVVHRSATFQTSNKSGEGTGLNTTGQFSGGQNADIMNQAMALSRDLLATKYGTETEYSPSDVAAFAAGKDPFAGTYDPTRDESMRARNTDPLYRSDLQNATGPGMSGKAQLSLGEDMTPPDINEFRQGEAQNADPASAQSPDAQDRNAGYLSDQRSQMFSPSDPLSDANSYLDSGTNIDVGGWSIPELPNYDPILPDYSSAIPDSGTGEEYSMPEIPPYVDAGGYANDTTGTEHGH